MSRSGSPLVRGFQRVLNKETKCRTENSDSDWITESESEYTPSPILSRVHRAEINPSRFSSPEIRCRDQEEEDNLSQHSSPEILRRERFRDRRNHLLSVNQGNTARSPGFKNIDQVVSKVLRTRRDSDFASSTVVHTPPPHRLDISSIHSSERDSSNEDHRQELINLFSKKNSRHTENCAFPDELKGPENSYSEAGSEREEFLKTESEEENPEPRKEKEENLKTRTEKNLNLGTRTENKSRIKNKENRVAEYAPEEEEVNDRLGSESAKYPSFKSSRLKRKRKLVNNTVSQIEFVRKSSRMSNSVAPFSSSQDSSMDPEKIPDLSSVPSSTRRQSKTADDSDIIIIVDADDDNTEEKPVFPSVSTRSQGSDQSAIDLCQFPEERCPSTVIVTSEDYRSLEEGEYLNDIIIDFYLTYLHNQVLNKEDRDNVYVFSSHFFSKLSNSPLRKHAKEKESEKNLSAEQKRYLRVERWTKNVDLFTKDMVIFPICQESHWFLIIAVKPGLIQKPADPEERLTRGEPFLILLDSMGGYKDKAVSIVRQYLSCEWKSKRGGTETFSARDMKLMKPNKPEQNNFTDCGVFLLHYVEKIFCSVAQFYWSKLPDLTNWFPMEEILKKRFELATHIQNLARSQKGVTQFPVIKLNNGDSSLRSKRRKGRADLDYGADSEETLNLPGISIRRLRTKDRERPEQRMSKLRTLKSAEVPSVLLGSDEPRLGEYKIPRRRRSETSQSSPEKSDRIASEKVPTRADPRHDNPAGISSRKFYGKVEPSQDILFDKLVKSPEKSRVEKLLKSEKVQPRQDQKEFISFLNKKNSTKDKEKFSQFLDSKNRKKPELPTMPKPAKVPEPELLIEEKLQEIPEPAIVLDESPECVSDSSSELVEITDPPEPLSEDDVMEVDDTSYPPVTNPSRRIRARVLSDTSSNDSVNVFYPPGRKTGVPKLFVDLEKQPTVPQLVLDPKRKPGVPKIVVDLDQGPSGRDQLMALRQFKKNLNNDLVNPSSKETNRSRKKEGTNEKFNRLDPHTYDSSKYRLFSLKSTETVEESSMETSGENFKPRPVSRGVVGYDPFRLPSNTSPQSKEKRYVLKNPMKTYEPKCYRFTDNESSTWDQIFKESKTSSNIFSDSSDLEN